MEDGGTLGDAHALLALLKQLAEFAVARGCFSSPDSWAPLTAPMQVSLWMQRWQHRLSTWLHVTLSQQLLRLCHPEGLRGFVVSLLVLALDVCLISMALVVVTTS